MTHRLPLSQLAECEHLNPLVWQKVNRLLLRKALSEFAHERLIQPTPMPNGTYQVHSDDGQIQYCFSAIVLDLNHWSIPADSIRKYSSGQEQPLDALLFMIELRHTLLLKGIHFPSD